MRSISKIKSAVDKRDKEPAPVQKKTLKTPASVREQDKKDDTVIQEQKRLTGQLGALEKAIGKKSKELDQIKDEIVEKMEKAVISGDEIIEAS